MIDGRFDSGEDINVCSADFLCCIHKEFYERVPEHFLKIYNPGREEYITMIPGKLSTDDVVIGNHVAIAWDRVPDFLNRFEEVYVSNSILGHKKL